jgi:hypothetical protein
MYAVLLVSMRLAGVVLHVVQIYSATTRILYYIIQNADDCSFEDVSPYYVDGQQPQQPPPPLCELLIECTEEALIAFHNEKGFQPKDLYAMCQVAPPVFAMRCKVQGGSPV